MPDLTPERLREIKASELCRCGEPHDEWPDANGGELCQMCWEADCSKSWWETCGGLLKPKPTSQEESNEHGSN